MIRGKDKSEWMNYTLRERITSSKKQLNNKDKIIGEQHQHCSLILLTDLITICAEGNEEEKYQEFKTDPMVSYLGSDAVYGMSLAKKRRPRLLMGL
jgi:hypothetical protein